MQSRTKIKNIRQMIKNNQKYKFSFKIPDNNPSFLAKYPKMQDNLQNDAVHNPYHKCIDHCILYQHTPIRLALHII